MLHKCNFRQEIIPRLGAFEVSINGVVSQYIITFIRFCFQLLYSKIEAKKWPDFEFLSQKCISFVEYFSKGMEIQLNKINHGPEKSMIYGYPPTRDISPISPRSFPVSRPTSGKQRDIERQRIKASVARARNSSQMMESKTDSFYPMCK